MIWMEENHRAVWTCHPNVREGSERGRKESAIQRHVVIAFGVSVLTRVALFALLLASVGCGGPDRKAVSDAPGVRPTQSEIPKELTLDLGGDVKMETVLIRAGKFLMGSAQGRFDNEKPVHEVTISQPFYLGKYPVTQEQWQAVMGSNPSRFRGMNRPVEGVSWNEAQEFCRKLSVRTGGTVRLPTEAEWEFACRAGSTTDYCFGDNEDGLAEYGWYEGNSSGTTHAVGEKKPNAWGLYDMHGNVWEWCHDWYEQRYDASSPRVDPQGPAQNALQAHVLRGGAWHVEASYCRSASRGGDFPCGEGGPGSWSHAGRNGFRIVVCVGNRTAGTHRQTVAPAPVKG
jgi:formylglycine-generating enzyme required for sulfatase activity